MLYQLNNSQMQIKELNVKTTLIGSLVDSNKRSINIKTTSIPPNIKKEKRNY